MVVGQFSSGIIVLLITSTARVAGNVTFRLARVLMKPSLEPSQLGVYVLHGCVTGIQLHNRMSNN